MKQYIYTWPGTDINKEDWATACAAGVKEFDADDLNILQLHNLPTRTSVTYVKMAFPSKKMYKAWKKAHPQRSCDDLISPANDTPFHRKVALSQLILATGISQPMEQSEVDNIINKMEDWMNRAMEAKLAGNTDEELSDAIEYYSVILNGAKTIKTPNTLTFDVTIEEGN